MKSRMWRASLAHKFMNSITLGRPASDVTNANGVEIVGRICIDVLLVGLHAVLPLEVLRHGDVARVARQKHHLLVIKVGLGIALPGVVFDVIVVREHDPGHAIGLVMQIVEADHRPLAEAVLQLIDAGEQHAQPGPPALAERDHDGIGEAQLAPVLAAAQPALEAPRPLLGTNGRCRAPVRTSFFDRVRLNWRTRNNG